MELKLVKCCCKILSLYHLYSNCSFSTGSSSENLTTASNVSVVVGASGLIVADLITGSELEINITDEVTTSPSISPSLGCTEKYQLSSDESMLVGTTSLPTLV